MQTHLPAGKSLDYTAVGLGKWNVSAPRGITGFILHKLIQASPQYFSFLTWANFPALSSAPHPPLATPHLQLLLVSPSLCHKPNNISLISPGKC